MPPIIDAIAGVVADVDREVIAALDGGDVLTADRRRQDVLRLTDADPTGFDGWNLLYTAANFDDDKETFTMTMDLANLRIGIVLSLLTLLFGFSLGGAFGAFEDTIMDSLNASAMTVRDSVYAGDDAAISQLTSKAWTYMKRAHLHANGLGTSTLVLILLLGTFPAGTMVRRAVSCALGAGALGYSSFWLFAARRAPVLGSTHDAKESLSWLAIPSAGLLILGLVAVLVLFVTHHLKNKD